MSDLLTCSECGLSPWDKHCCECEPCVEKQRARYRQRIAALEAEVARLRDIRVGAITEDDLLKGIQRQEDK